MIIEQSNNFKALIQQLLYNDYKNYKNFTYGIQTNNNHIDDPTLFQQENYTFQDSKGETNPFINLNPF
jgi:hypothetical protein